MALCVFSRPNNDVVRWARGCGASSLGLARRLGFGRVDREREERVHSLSEKVVLVTGAASGIGAATCRAARAAGARVIAADLAEDSAIAAASGAASEDMVVRLDVADEAGVDACVSAAIARFGRIDGLVNCAGIQTPGPAHTTELAVWNRVLGVQLTGTFLVSKRVVQEMLKAQAGAIVNIASIYGMTGGPGNVSYNTAKGGVLQLTRSMAADYGAVGIRVNSVSPGYIETPMSAMLKNAGQFRDRFVAMHALRRPGQPEEVAGAIVFLLSDAASFITAANLPVDGGFASTHIIP
jgi:NAD(P)-dependent dehydrogenase (short-subunit alcohol dehydrogenase family)